MDEWVYIANTLHLHTGYTRKKDTDYTYTFRYLTFNVTW